MSNLRVLTVLGTRKSKDGFQGDLPKGGGVGTRKSEGRGGKGVCRWARLAYRYFH